MAVDLQVPVLVERVVAASLKPLTAETCAPSAPCVSAPAEPEVVSAPVTTITGGDVSLVVGEVGIVSGSRHVIDDVDVQRAVGVITVTVGDDNGKAIAVVDAVRGAFGEKIGVGDRSVGGIVAGDRQDPMIAYELLAGRPGNNHTIDRNSRGRIALREMDRTARLFGPVAVVVGIAVGALARPRGQTIVRRQALFINHRARFASRRNVDRWRVIGIIDCQRRGRRVAVAIGQRIGEDVNRAARRVLVAASRCSCRPRSSSSVPNWPITTKPPAASLSSVDPRRCCSRHPRRERYPHRPCRRRSWSCQPRS